MKNKIIHAISTKHNSTFTITAEPARTRTVMVAGGEIQRINTPGIVLIEKRWYNETEICVYAFEPGTKQIGMKIPNLYFLSMSHMGSYESVCLDMDVRTALNKGKISAHEALWCTEFSEVHKVQCEINRVFKGTPFTLRHCFGAYSDLEYDPPGVIDLD